MCKVKDNLGNWKILAEESSELLYSLGKFLGGILGEVTEDMFKQLPAIAQQISGKLIFFFFPE